MRWVKHQWSLFDKRWLIATLVVVAVVLAAGGVEDHRSCLRTLNTRIKFNEYVDAATIARLDSAVNEASRDPVQAQIDKTAATKFLRTKSPIPNCNTIPAGT